MKSKWPLMNAHRIDYVDGSRFIYQHVSKRDQLRSNLAVGWADLVGHDSNDNRSLRSKEAAFMMS